MRSWQEQFRCEVMTATRSLPIHKQQPQNSYRNVRFTCRSTGNKTSQNIARLKVAFTIALFFHLAISSFIWLHIIRTPDLTKRSFRQYLAFVRFLNVSRERHIDKSKYVSITFEQNIFTSTRKIAAPPPMVVLGKDDWEPEIIFYNEDMEEVENISDDMVTDSNDCYQLPWTKLQFPVCNIVHEIVIDSSRDRYLGHGYYRDVWLLQEPHPPDDRLHHQPDIVLKQIILPIDDDDVAHGVSATSLAKIHKEALIMERLTSSPRIVNIYGHCGTSVAAEAGEDGVAETIVPNSGQANRTMIENLPQIQSFNSLTSMNKLDIAIEMSKAIVDLHGFSEGIIVHGDIHPVQWLISRANNGLQLNDFNNAEILSIKRHPSTDENVTYCKTDRGTWSGVFRSPEEYLGDPIDEQIDVYSMGNIIYALLTGLWPFYDIIDYDAIKERVLHSERPYIDNRYYSENNIYIERKMIQVMKSMWDDKPNNRPTIFEVVSFLSKVRRDVREAKSHSSDSHHIEYR